MQNSSNYISGTAMTLTKEMTEKEEGGGRRKNGMKKEENYKNTKTSSWISGRRVLLSIVVVLIAWQVIRLWEFPVPWKTIELAKASGYEAHEHTVLTEDGYFLTMHQIPPLTCQQQQQQQQLSSAALSSPSPSSSSSSFSCVSKKGVVFMQHGLLESSAVWLLHGRDSLAFLLAAQGFEVWLGNSRGNQYGSTHVDYTTEDPDFWNWTWYDMALYDLPAQLRYVLNYTKSEKLFYVGQSQGAAQAFAGLSLNPELLSHIQLLVAVAPGMFLRQSSNSALRFLFDNVNLFGQHQFVPYVFLRNYMPKHILGMAGEFCMRSLEFIASPINTTAAPILYSVVPSGSTSSRNVHYWVQLVRAGEFQMPDLGEEENLKRYNSPTPPNYPIEKVDCPIALFLAGKDTTVDAAKTIERLSHHHLHVEEQFAHADFIWSSSAIEIYPKIIQQLLHHLPTSPHSSDSSS